jgi:hypothetical protein
MASQERNDVVCEIHGSVAVGPGIARRGSRRAEHDQVSTQNECRKEWQSMPAGHAIHRVFSLPDWRRASARRPGNCFRRGPKGMTENGGTFHLLILAGFGREDKRNCR